MTDCVQLLDSSNNALLQNVFLLKEEQLISDENHLNINESSSEKYSCDESTNFAGDDDCSSELELSPNPCSVNDLFHDLSIILKHLRSSGVHVYEKKISSNGIDKKDEKHLKPTVCTPEMVLLICLIIFSCITVFVVIFYMIILFGGIFPTFNPKLSLKGIMKISERKSPNVVIYPKSDIYEYFRIDQASKDKTCHDEMISYKSRQINYPMMVNATGLNGNSLKVSVLTAGHLTGDDELQFTGAQVLFGGALIDGSSKTVSVRKDKMTIRGDADAAGRGSVEVENMDLDLKGGRLRNVGSLGLESEDMMTVQSLRAEEVEASSIEAERAVIETLSASKISVEGAVTSPSVDFAISSEEAKAQKRGKASSRSKVRMLPVDGVLSIGAPQPASSVALKAAPKFRRSLAKQRNTEAPYALSDLRVKGRAAVGASVAVGASAARDETALAVGSAAVDDSLAVIGDAASAVSFSHSSSLSSSPSSSSSPSPPSTSPSTITRHKKRVKQEPTEVSLFASGKIITENGKRQSQSISLNPHSPFNHVQFNFEHLTQNFSEMPLSALTFSSSPSSSFHAATTIQTPEDRETYSADSNQLLINFVSYRGIGSALFSYNPLSPSNFCAPISFSGACHRAYCSEDLGVPTIVIYNPLNPDFSKFNELPLLVDVFATSLSNNSRIYITSFDSDTFSK